MVRITQKLLDRMLDAAREEGRDEARREETNRLVARSMDRIYIHAPDAPMFTIWGGVKAGDVILATGDGVMFHQHYRVTGVKRADSTGRPVALDEAWIESEGIDYSGTCGSRVKLADRVLIAR